MPDDLPHLPHPALLNCWKHHAGWIRQRIAAAASAGSAGVAALPAEMAAVGARLMDLYTGSYSPAEIAESVFADLKAHDIFEFQPLAQRLARQGGYAMFELGDGSEWTVRLGPADGRYIHLHPGRWVLYTMRVQANTLKSAVMAHAHAKLTGRAADDLVVVNEARKLYLGMLPVRELTGDGGLGAVISALAN